MSEAAAGRLPAVRPREVLALLVLAVLILAPGIASLPPVDRDEPRYAVASTQMLSRGDFVDIRYQEAPRYLQPAGIYWLQAASTALFGRPGAPAIWTFRLPSLLGALAAVAATALFAGRRFGREVGLAAGLLLASCLSLGFEARIAKTDAALLAAVCVAQFSLLRAYAEGPLPRRNAAALWAALGAGVLLKGPIILLVSGLTVLALIAWDRRAAWLKGLRARWGVPLALAIALPWYVAIGVRSHGGFFRTAIGRSLLGKVAKGQQAHGAPFGYHLAALPLTFWPGSLLLALALPLAWRERRTPAVRFLIAWIVPSWIVFESVKTKLPHYVLPLFPALACLCALALYAPRRQGGAAPWRRWAFVAWAALWALVSLGVAAAGPALLNLYTNGSAAVAVSLAVAVAGAAAVMLFGLARKRPRWVVAAAAAASLCAALDVYVATLPRLDRFWISPRAVALARRAAPCPGGELISFPDHEPSLVFLNGPDRTRLADSPQAAADRLAHAGPCGLAMIDGRAAAAFESRAQALGLALRPVGRLGGRDYADNRTLDLTLFAAAPPPNVRH